MPRAARINRRCRGRKPGRHLSKHSKRRSNCWWTGTRKASMLKCLLRASTRLERRRSVIRSNRIGPAKRSRGSRSHEALGHHTSEAHQGAARQSLHSVLCSSPTWSPERAKVIVVLGPLPRGHNVIHRFVAQPCCPQARTEVLTYRTFTCPAGRDLSRACARDTALRGR